MNETSFRVGVLVCLLAILVACSKTPNDAQVTADIQSRLGADSGLQNKQISVQAANGTVTLSGNGFNYDSRTATLQATTTGVYFRSAWAQCTPTWTGSDPNSGCGGNS